MTVRAPSWPKLIGVFVLILGVAWSLKASDFVFIMAESLSVGVYVWLVAVGGSVASVVLGIAAYSAREWARRTLVVITTLAIVLAIGYAYLGVTRSITGLGRIEPEFIFWSRFVFVGEALRAVAPPVFFLLVLLHRDVVRSFKHAATPTV
jgi:hypothetical protein